MPDITELVETRKLIDSDKKLVASACIKSIMCNDKQFLPKIINKLLDICDIHVVCSKADTEQVLSFLIADSECVYFAYTKADYRNFGLLQMLLEQLKGDQRYYCFITSSSTHRLARRLKLKSSPLHYLKHFN